MKRTRIEILKDYRDEFSVAVYLHRTIWQGTCSVDTYYDKLLKFIDNHNYGALTNLMKRLGFIRNNEIVYPNSYPIEFYVKPSP